jgi:Fungal hydrophobin
MWSLAPTVPTSADNFKQVCSAIGQQARCCVLPIVSALLCLSGTVGLPHTDWPYISSNRVFSAIHLPALLSKQNRDERQLQCRIGFV